MPKKSAKTPDPLGDAFDALSNADIAQALARKVARLALRSQAAAHDSSPDHQWSRDQWLSLAKAADEVSAFAEQLHEFARAQNEEAA